MSRLKVLFLCTGNSCRSQMAEGWTKALYSGWIDAYSAGVETHGMNPNAVQVMQEAGVDITAHYSKHVNELKDIPFDVVVTVCDSANECCPLFPGKTKVIHHCFEDPPQLAKGLSEVQALEIYRRVRDEIKQYIESFPQLLKQEAEQ